MNIKKLNIHSLCILLAAILWGTAGLFVRTLQGFAFDPMQLVFARAVVSSLLLGIIILIKDIKLFKIRFKDMWLFAAAGLFSIIMFNYAYYTTMSLTSLSVAAVLLYTAPFFVVIISVPLFKEKLNSKKVSACLIAFVGCCFVSGLFDSSHRISSKALFFGLLTGFGYGLYTIFGELLIKRGYKTLTITLYIFLFATVFTVPMINTSATVKYCFSEPKALITIILMAIFNTVIPYIFYTVGLSGVDPSVAPVIATVEPVAATVLGAVVYKEAISIYGIIGILLVLSSVAILNSKRVRIAARAKINLTLAVTGKREDGYHLIDTVMQSVTLADRITVAPSEKIEVICDKQGEISGEKNIAFSAARLFFEKTGICGGAKIRISKNIPLAAGLGGGSADAAAVLLALDRLFNTGLSKNEMEVMALSLGADVPFFIRGGTQRAEGIGEILTALSDFKGGYFVLAKAGEKPSTGEMYKRLDSEQAPQIAVDLAVQAINNGQNGAACFQGNSFDTVWKNDALKKRLAELKPVATSLSGSGPTRFAYFKTKQSAVKVLKALKSEKIECFLVRPCRKAIKFV
ncbi:MAG: 4-(cytidine 5'-diphospho)-2-C-methyl-D-erythritol kinase [Clostridia bacterium]|nr:4-(cytidine 5'-diphospho)-2-C-methyl-D-erythritol kinase [Clostridia bacterium]